MIAQTHTAVFRGLETAWMEAGEVGKPILLFLHGYPDSPQTWEFQLNHFLRSYHVVAPYSRGAGPSEKAPRVSRYGGDASALDVLQILKKIDPSGKTPVSLVGHDLGAVHAWNVAALLGPRLQALVIVNGLSLQAMMGRLRSLQQHRRSWYIYAMQLPWVPEAVSRAFPQRILKLAHTLGKLPAPHRLGVDQVENCLEHTVNQYRAFVRDIPKQRRRRLPRLQCPVMVLWGKEDPFLVTPSVAEWEQAAANITTRILPAGHWVHRERAPEVNRLIEKFLAQKAPEANV